MFEPVDLESLLRLFTFKKKRELEKYCRNAVVHKRDFATLVMACKSGMLPFSHQIHYKDHVPPQLIPSDKEHAALQANGVGPLKGDAKKLVRKIGQLFKDRRYLVGHIFYTPNLHEWHFFYFDQRDTEEQNENHWSGGSHIHFINWLWPNHVPTELWSNFVSQSDPPKGAVHIRFISKASDLKN